MPLTGALLKAAAADGFDASFVPVHRDAAQALASQHSGGCFLGQLFFGWIQLLAHDAPPTGSALAEVLPDDLVGRTALSRRPSSCLLLTNPPYVVCTRFTFS